MNMYDDAVELVRKTSRISYTTFCYRSASSLCIRDLIARQFAVLEMHSMELRYCPRILVPPGHHYDIIPSPRALTISAVHNPASANQRFRAVR